MLRYSKVINEETKQCQIGVGTNTAFYQKIGMIEMEVEQAYNGLWYVAGYAPEEPEAEKKAKRKAELIAELAELDLKQIRSLAAKAAGTATDEDLAILADLEEQKAIKRNELKELQGAE